MYSQGVLWEDVPALQRYSQGVLWEDVPALQGYFQGVLWEDVPALPEYLLEYTWTHFWKERTPKLFSTQNITPNYNESLATWIYCRIRPIHQGTLFPAPVRSTSLLPVSCAPIVSNSWQGSMGLPKKPRLSLSRSPLLPGRASCTTPPIIFERVVGGRVLQGYPTHPRSFLGSWPSAPWMSSLIGPLALRP